MASNKDRNSVHSTRRNGTRRNGTWTWSSTGWSSEDRGNGSWQQWGWEDSGSGWGWQDGWQQDSEERRTESSAWNTRYGESKPYCYNDGEVDNMAGHYYTTELVKDTDSDEECVTRYLGSIPHDTFASNVTTPSPPGCPAQIALNSVV